MKAFLDTHAAVFLWEGRGEAFGAASSSLLERAALFVSPVVSLELGMLREIGRITVRPERLMSDLAEEHAVVAAGDPLEAVVARSLALTWTRDPFDRLQVATAMLHGAPFVTRDRRIHEHFGEAVW